MQANHSYALQTGSGVGCEGIEKIVEVWVSNLPSQNISLFSNGNEEEKDLQVMLSFWCEVASHQFPLIPFLRFAASPAYQLSWSQLRTC